MLYTEEVKQVVKDIATAAVEEILFDIANHDEIRDMINDKLAEKYRVDLDTLENDEFEEEFNRINDEVTKDVAHIVWRMIYTNTDPYQGIL